VGRGKALFLKALLMKYKYSLILLVASFIDAKVPNTISFQGYTGLINIPNAQVLDNNSFAFSLNNHFDNHLRGYDKSKKRYGVSDFQFGVSLLPNLEVFGRVKEQRHYARDLSGNFKFKIPNFSKFLPDIAIGAQDIGGLANLYTAYYIVADKELQNLRVTLGYGYSKNSRAKRLDGFFGGIEYAFNKNIVGAIDYDGKEKHIAIKAITPKDWLNGVSLEAMLAKNLNDKSYSFGLSAKFLYDYKKGNINNVDKKSVLKRINTNLSKRDAIDKFFKLLNEDGFNKIKLLSNSKFLVIRYENSIYRNDADALYSIIKKGFIVNRYYKYLVLEPSKSGIVQNRLIVNLKKAISYYKDPTDNIDFIAKYNRDIKNLKLLKFKDENKLHIEVSPILKTFVATEVGIFDYQLLMGVKGYYNILKGFDISGEYDFTIARSKNFNPKRGVFADSYNKGGLNSLLAHYTFKYKDIINTTSVGLYRYEYLGVMNQTSLLYNNHFFKWAILSIMANLNILIGKIAKKFLLQNIAIL